MSLESTKALAPQTTNLSMFSGYLDAKIKLDIPPSLHPNKEYFITPIALKLSVVTKFLQWLTTEYLHKGCSNISIILIEPSIKFSVWRSAKAISWWIPSKSSKVLPAEPLDLRLKVTPNGAKSTRKTEQIYRSLTCFKVVYSLTFNINLLGFL